MDKTPLPLQRQCLMYIILNLERFPVSSLSLLPVSMRHKILRNLPVADVCQLEETTFTAGLDLDDIWSTVCFKHPLSPDFPEQHFKSVYTFTSMKDYFFTYVFYLILTGSVPAVQQIQLKARLSKGTVTVRGLTPGTSREGFLSFCNMFISLTSCAEIESHSSIVQSLLKPPNTAEEPCIPTRYRHFIEDFDNEKLPQAMANLVLRTCKYRPRAININCSRLADTLLWKENSVGNLLPEIFKGVKYLHIMFSEVFRQNKLEACWGCMQAILPAALQTVEHLRLHFQTAFSLEFMVQVVLPPISKLVSQNKSSLKVLAVSIDKRRPGESDQIPETVELLIQSLPSSLYKSNNFTTLILEGMNFRLGEVVPNILATFLSLPCSQKQRLVLSRVFSYSTPTSYPKFSVIECGLEHKELKFHNMVPQKGLFNWILEEPGLGLHSLEFPLESGTHIRSSTEDIYDSSDYRVRKTGFEACAKNKTLRVRNLSLHLHLLPHRNMTEHFQSVFQNPTIRTLKLTCCNLGPGEVLADVTQGLLAHRNTGTLQELDLSSNLIGQQPDKELQNFFGALFKLPQLSELNVDLSHNELTSRNFEIMAAQWKEHAHTSKLKYLAYRGNYYTNVHVVEKMAESFDVGCGVFGK